MKVVICNKFYKRFGGPETVIQDSTRLLESDGHEVIPFSMSHPDNWPTKWSDYFVSQVNYHGKPSAFRQIGEAINIVYSREAKDKMERLLDTVKPDIVHAHNIYHQLSPSILGPMKKRGIPVVMSLHDYKLACPNMLFYVNGEICERCSGGKFYNAITHKCVFGSSAKSAVCALEMYVHRITQMYLKNVDVFISPSQFLIDALERCGVHGKRMVHIPNVADIDTYSATYDNDGYILYFGKLTPEKGVRTLIRAVSQVPSAKLVVAGTGSEADELKALAEETAPGRITFAGFLTGEKLKQAIERCAFFVMPSVWYENCPCTILETFSAGKPIVASRIGGIPELIEENLDGMTFEPGNHEELAEKIAALLSNQTRMVAMGKAGREKMERNYSLTAHYARLLEIYRDLVPDWPESKV
jgi:glycosyltransferase involved in cell wall biosynthesis